MMLLMQATATQEPVTLVAILSTANLVLVGIVTYFAQGFVSDVRTFMRESRSFREKVHGRVSVLEQANGITPGDID